ncbi:hypothetical protein [Herbiconiux sp. VKM Ac-2851]|uniref:hypothetical protein n=1 Tax=Herbiconiux sp. VKM Ac-2851 TaxID=2739025 RepID=UPI001563F9EC|nr:hypothetical protein [Herbiconiux sp. VKM Ac-2851]NQX37086.1 hypothetical protein [Herbiconiux sp. VKM Ac-2851]
MTIPEPIRLWWYDGPGVRVIRYSSRQWGIYVLVCAAMIGAIFIPAENSLSQGLHAVVPVPAIPAGLFALACNCVASARTRRFRAGIR